jgi:hypothetical protein
MSVATITPHDAIPPSLFHTEIVQLREWGSDQVHPVPTRGSGACSAATRCARCGSRLPACCPHTPSWPASATSGSSARSAMCRGSCATARVATRSRSSPASRSAWALGLACPMARPLVGEPRRGEDGVRGLSSGAAPRGPRCGRARARSRSDVATEGPLARVDLVEDVLRAGAGWPRPRDPLLGPAPGVRHGAEEACSLIGLAPSDCFRGRGPQAEIDRRCWSLPYADGEMGSY